MAGWGSRGRGNGWSGIGRGRRRYGAFALGADGPLDALWRDGLLDLSLRIGFEADDFHLVAEVAPNGAQGELDEVAKASATLTCIRNDCNHPELDETEISNLSDPAHGRFVVRPRQAHLARNRGEWS